MKDKLKNAKELRYYIVRPKRLRGLLDSYNEVLSQAETFRRLNEALTEELANAYAARANVYEEMAYAVLEAAGVGARHV